MTVVSTSATSSAVTATLSAFPRACRRAGAIGGLAAAGVLVFATPASALGIDITVENLAAANGIAFAPLLAVILVAKVAEAQAPDAKEPTPEAKAPEAEEPEAKAESKEPAAKAKEPEPKAKEPEADAKAKEPKPARAPGLPATEVSPVRPTRAQPGEVLITASHLTKYYGGFVAVRDVSFEVRRGEVVAFLGPNGAGKSTTMKILTGVVAPHEGVAEICGCNSLEQRIEVAHKLGYLPENGPLYEGMTPEALLRFLGARAVPGLEEVAADGAYRTQAKLEGNNPDLYDGYPIRFRLNINGQLPGLFRAALFSGDFNRHILEQLQSGKLE